LGARQMGLIEKVDIEELNPIRKELEEVYVS